MVSPRHKGARGARAPCFKLLSYRDLAVVRHLRENRIEIERRGFLPRGELREVCNRRPDHRLHLVQLGYVINHPV